jgi:hypothetical protein
VETSARATFTKSEITLARDAGSIQSTQGARPDALGRDRAERRIRRVDSFLLAAHVAASMSPDKWNVHGTGRRSSNHSGQGSSTTQPSQKDTFLDHENLSVLRSKRIGTRVEVRIEARQ